MKNSSINMDPIQRWPQVRTSISKGECRGCQGGEAVLVGRDLEAFRNCVGSYVGCLVTWAIHSWKRQKKCIKSQKQHDRPYFFCKSQYK